MNKNRMLIIVLALAALLASPAIAESYTIENVDGVASATQADNPAFADAGLRGWTLQNFSFAGVDWFVFKLAGLAAVYPFHSGPDEWIGYVLEGAGQCRLGDANNNQKGTVAFKKGDFLLFKGDTVHSWLNGPNETQILFLKATPKQ